MLRLLEQVPRFPDCPFVVPNQKTKKPYVSIFYSWNTARKQAGKPELRMHDLRHSFASFLINAGRSLCEVQSILGHTQVKTTPEQKDAHFVLVIPDSPIQSQAGSGFLYGLALKLFKSGEDVAELRVDIGAGYRVYYGKHGQTLVILLCGGDKGSQQADITHAKAYWTD